MTTPDTIGGLFADAGCQVCLHARPVDGDTEVSIDADRPMVAASVIKVAIVLTALRAFDDGRLDPRERVRLRAADRTPGPSGTSRYADDVEMSLRDCLQPTLTISDNATTDAVLHRVGLPAVHALLAELGMTCTRLPYDLAQLIAVLQAAGDQAASSAAFDPAETISTTARDQTTLLSSIWTDRAAGADACRQVRTIMAGQLSGKPRFATAVAPDWQLAAKSGSLYGLVRNEIGVLTAPDGRAYAVAVLTRTKSAQPGRSPVDGLIGRAAWAAVRSLAA